MKSALKISITATAALAALAMLTTAGTAAFDLTVNGANPAPAITSLLPASVIVGAAEKTLTINGSGFVAGSTVTYNGRARSVVYVGAHRLIAQLSAADKATTGSYAIVVTNASPGGGASRAVNFYVMPQSGLFILTKGDMIAERVGHTATLLLDGTTVLVAGGQKLNLYPFPPTTNASAELFEATTGTFTATGSMATPRSGHSATLLANTALAKVANYGRVLVIGGGSQTAELYNPATRLFTATGSPLVARRGQTATLLHTGKVLVAGGGTDTAELYDPVKGASRQPSAI